MTLFYHRAILLLSFLKGDIYMKKIAMIISMVVMAAIISGFSINAEQNTDVTYPILKTINKEELNQPYQSEIDEVVEEIGIPKDRYQDGNSVVSGGATWIYTKIQEGKAGSKTTQYQKLLNQDAQVLSRIEIPNSEEIIDAMPTVYEGGQAAQEKTSFNPSEITISTTGSEKKTSSNVVLGAGSVKQQDGSWKKGIMYEGYHIVTTSTAIPLLSIIEVQDHSMSGMGIQAGVPFKAIVLDRSSSITGSQVDLFVGSNKDAVSLGNSKETKIEILSINNSRLAPVKEVAKVVTSPHTQTTSNTTGGESYEASRITRYGADCYGCRISADGKGKTASGIGVGIDSVQQEDGSWQSGITYEGYYIVAASSNLPLYSIIEISNHTVSGMGITPGVPFQAIILDRGGAIQGTKIDLFVGTENNMPVSQGRRQNATVKIIK